MTARRTVRFTVNGHDAEATARADAPLLYVLRNDLGLKGTRFGCGQGLCGACTVHIDGQAAFSCDVPLWAVEGKRVTTIEGLGSESTPHPLQTAIVDRQAGQCGYCLTGIVMRVAAHLEREPGATEGEIRKALERNLCRCGAHTRILAAIGDAQRVLAERAA